MVPYPLLLPEVPVVWRDDRTLQVGLDPARAVAAGTRELRALTSLDGTRSLARILADHASTGGDALWLRSAIDELAAAGCIVDGRPGTWPAVPAPEDARLAPDVAAWSLAAPGTAASSLARRRSARVTVRGSGRVGVGVAALLTAAGVGEVRVTPIVGDASRVSPRCVAPLGPRASSVGAPARLAARDAAAGVGFGRRTVAPTTPVTPPGLLVLCPPRIIAPETTEQLSVSGRPHLVVVSDGPSARIGPLVVPGVTPCLRCLELHRADRDPSWPLVCAQVAGHRGAQRPAVDSVLATLAASVGALHALAVIDGRSPLPSSAGAIVEMRLPGLEWSRRSWGVHPDCGCHWEPDPLAA